MDAWLAWAGLVVAVLTFLRGEYNKARLQKNHLMNAAIQSNVASLVSLWQRIGQKPSLLRFHGITEDDLKNAGVEADELSYLIASFEACQLLLRLYRRQRRTLSEKFSALQDVRDRRLAEGLACPEEVFWI